MKRILKRSDIFTITIVVSVGMLMAFLISNAILGDPDMEKVSFNVVEPVSDTVDDPDPELFNSKAINPTVEVEVGVCEDTNGNGILDQDERDRCLGAEVESEINEDESDTNDTVVTEDEVEDVTTN